MAKGSNTFGGTVKLDGESEYRKALSNITTKLGVVSSEMNKVTAEFGKNDKSMEGLTKKNEVLNSKLQNQEDKVNTLRSALEQAKDQYGETDEKTLKWQKSLNNAEADVIKTKKAIDDNNSAMKDLDNATDKNADSMKDFEKAERSAGDQTLKLGDLIKANLISDAIKSGLVGLANGVKSVANSMTSAIANGTSYADEILTLSAQTGIATEELQEYKAVAELTDVPLETITKSMSKMTKSLESNEDKYKKLGVSIRNSDGSLRNNQEVFNETIGALGKMENATERDALSMQLFGKSAQELNPLIKMGADGLNELTTQAHEMGAILSEEGLKSLGELDDEFQLFKSTVGSTGNILASAFAPMLTGIMSDVNGLAGDFNYLIASVISGSDEGVDNALNNISISIQNISNTIGEQAPKIIEIIGSLIKTVGKALIDNLPVITESGLKIISELINGISGNIGSVITVVLDVLLKIAEALIQNLPTILTAIIQIITSVIQSLSNELPKLIPLIVNAVIDMVNALLDNIDLIIDAGIQLIMGLTQGLLDALPQLIDRLPEIIDKLVTALTNNLPKLIEAGIQLTIALAGGLIKAIPQLISKIPQIIKSLFNGFKNYYGSLGEIGLNMVKGILNGFLNVGDIIWQTVKKFGKSMIDSIKKFFKIHSPAQNEDLIWSAKMIAQGVGIGFTDEMKNVSKDMADAIPTDFDITPNVQTGFIGKPYYNQIDKNDNSDNGGSFTAIINNNSKYTSPSENIRRMRQEYELYRLKYGKVGA